MESSDKNQDNTSSDSFSPDAKIFRIGRFSGNEIVLARDGVAEHHADLIIDGYEVHLRDSGTEAGTAIGTPDRHIDQAIVGEDDLVFFGAFSIKVRHLIAMTRRPVESASSRPAGVAVKPVVDNASPSASRNYILLTAGSVLGVAILTVFMWVRSNSTSSQGNQSTDLSAPKKQAELLATKQDGNTIGTPLVTAAADALFMLIAESRSDENAQRIGTAWLVKPDRLRTSPSIVSDIRKRKDQGQSVLAVQSSTGETIVIEASDDDERSLQLQSRPKQGEPAPIAPAVDLKIDQRLHLHAVPFANKNPSYDPSIDPDPHGVEVIVEAKDASRIDTSNVAWTMLMQLSIEGPNYSGSPILNHQGQVVATYDMTLVENDRPEHKVRFSASAESP